MGSAAKPNKAQKAAAAVIVPDARCTPVLIRAAIVGRARMPRAALEITRPSGEVIGNVVLANTSRAFDPLQRFWLVGEPEVGGTVALVSEGCTQVILPGSPLRAGALREPQWSALASRMLGWQRQQVPAGAPEGFHAVFSTDRASITSPEFKAAVKRFRNAAVNVPMLFFAVCFPYLFFIRALAEAGTSPILLLALPVLGGGVMTAWSAQCRRAIGVEAELIEAGASKWDKEIAFTQSYWAWLRKPATTWDGPLPNGAC